MKATKGFAVALLVLGAAACGRRDNVPSQTNTTSSDYDRSGDMSGTPAPAAPMTPQDLPPAGGTGAGTSYMGDVDQIDQNNAGYNGQLGAGNDVMRGKDGGGRSSGISGNTTTGNADMMDTPSADRAGSTSITSGDVGSAGGTDSANVQNGAKSNDSAGKNNAANKNNKSTTLGNGQSGEYTGGQGTYGGKATHGTGGTSK